MSRPKKQPSPTAFLIPETKTPAVEPTEKIVDKKTNLVNTFHLIPDTLDSQLVKIVWTTFNPQTKEEISKLTGPADDRYVAQARIHRYLAIISSGGHVEDFH